MSHVSNIPVATTLLLMSWVAGLGSVAAAERMTVVFKTGRSVKVQLDPRTDEAKLWLEFGSGRTHVTRSVGWDEVASIYSGDQTLSPEAVRQMAQTQIVHPEKGARSPMPLSENPRPDTNDSRNDPLPTWNVMTRPRLQAVRFDAVLANWDADVEMDGLLVQVQPLSWIGQPMNVCGILNVELWSMKRIQQDSAPHSRGRSLEVVGRWSTSIRTSSDDTDPWIQLPFQARHPEFDFNWSSMGLVHLELVVPGQGVFHHTEDGIRIRPFAPLRDALQRQTGERFLPTELTGRK